MNDWQDVAVVGLIAGAAVYLGYMLWRRLARRSTACCRDCHACPASKDASRRQELLQVQELPDSDRIPNNKGPRES